MVRMILWWENLKETLRSEKGQGMVEYVILLVVIAAIAAGLAFTGVSTAITTAIGKVQASIGSVGN